MYYDHCTYDQEELAGVMRKTYGELICFVTSPEFKSVLKEMSKLPPEAYPTFVKVVLLNKDELAARGVTIPEGILIQRSAFGDRRPTLFAVKKFLPKKYHNSWENVNLTFDSLYDDADVSRDGDVAWRRPLTVEDQAQLMTRDVSLETVSDESSLQMGAFGGTRVPKSPLDAE